MSLLNKLFSAKDGSAFGGKNKKKEAIKETKLINEEKKVATEVKKPIVKSDFLLTQMTTEKAVSGQSLNQYVFKVAPGANKIEIIKAVGKTYNVTVVSAHIMNTQKKVRRVGKTQGFKPGYKKAIVTLTKGQTIEFK